MALINSFWKRHQRGLFIFALFLTPVLPLLLLRVDLPRFHLYDRVQAWFVHPTAEAVGNAAGGAGELWSRYIDLVNASKENELLKKEVSELHLRILSLEEDGRENERLKKILSMPDLQARGGIAAKIIGYDGSHDSLSFVINAGTQQGVIPRLPVITSEGIVGTVARVFRNSSIVTSFLDPNHDTDGLIVRSRARMIVEGRGRVLLARLKYLDRSEDARVGDLVVTGGLDGVFPKGLPVGSIVKVYKRDSGVTQESELRAAVDPGRLEEVVVLKLPSAESTELTVNPNPQAR